MFRVRRSVRGIFGDPYARIVTLERWTRRTVCGVCREVHFGWYDRRQHLVRDLSSGDTRVYLDVEIRRVYCVVCRAVKKERLDEILGSPFVTKRFAFFVGRRCRAATVLDVARELHLSWQTTKGLDVEYMTEQLRRHPVKNSVHGPH